jgi:tRNA A-37 threonylcarbamoyl transferase component Bud32
VHRDLKPSNIRHRRRRFELLDFGVAKLLAAGDEEANARPRC